MPTKNKTAETTDSVADFINSWVEKEEKRQDSFRLIELMRKWTGHEPRMWGLRSLALEAFTTNTPVAVKAI